MVLFIRPNSSVPCTTTAVADTNHFVDQDNQIRPSLQLANAPSLLDFMKSMLVLMVSQELFFLGSFFSLSFSLASLPNYHFLGSLTCSTFGAAVVFVWITNQNPPKHDQGSQFGGLSLINWRSFLSEMCLNDWDDTLNAPFANSDLPLTFSYGLKLIAGLEPHEASHLTTILDFRACSIYQKCRKYCD
ncbi:hypothetical protein PIB30_055084 [Stylosanthes scabra]|uniref:Uncharacterized protein n=1 Tax=Stylosanthes scabra TaxID=79078 RepID=A0ABU6RIW3_9FABA|nr:hypothetical protein [Stylosanthes scabra]